MKKLLFSLFFFSLLLEFLNGQSPATFSASDILLRMKKLEVLGSVLYIAAHPDDENNRLLAWLSQEKLYQTGYLSLTRGDGGQNLIGDEQGIELGLIRTQELLAARRLDGADQFFSRAYDFGFSKTTTETLSMWNEQKILGDVVWVIRKYQPDIIVTRFPEDKRAGHGQHSASSVLAHLAFSAAADPKQFPEQFAFGVSPWQATRLFWNNYNFGNVNTIREDQLKIEVGGFNPYVGKSYGEIAADSRSQHRSQGFGIPHSRGNFLEYFSLTEGTKADSSLMEHINCGWDRISGGTPVSRMIEAMIRQYDPAAPYLSLKSLVEIFKLIKALPQGHWRDEKLNETVILIRACSGLFLEATVPEAYAQQDQTIPVTVRIVNRAPIEMVVRSVSLNKQDTSWNQSLQAGVNYSFVRPVSLRSLPVSQPYWLVEPMSSGSFNVQGQLMIGLPENPPVLEAEFDIQISGELFKLHQPVYFKYTDPARGEFFEPFSIVPYQMAYCEPELLVFSRTSEQKLVVKNQWKTKLNENQEIPVMHPASISTEKKSIPNTSSISLTPMSNFKSKDLLVTDTEHDFILKAEVSNSQRAGVWATRLTNDGVDTLLQCRTISYEHIPRIDYFKLAKSVLVNVKLQIRGNRIGYIDGAGDKVAEVLTAMGYTIVKINENSVTPSGLENLDALVAGVRAYEVHPWLKGKYKVIMDYIKNGGNLIVQYNRNLGNDSTGIGPYPFSISNIRVTEEDAPVKFLLPAHRLLHFPNEITVKDFEGWVQERGIYFAQHADSNYQSVFSMHDTGELDQSGSLITGTYGKGNFTYTGLVFFRELPAGVPGAYRLFANLIALNQPSNK